MQLRKMSWSVDEITSQIHALAREVQSPYNEGFTSFELKKDLYQIKEVLDTALRRCPTFHGEQEWLTEQEQKRIIAILKRD
jgi:ABC-type phosphate/phosphonate transport system ATPase subunit